jgi:hypothetical protein
VKDMEIEQVKYILEDKKYKNYIEIDFYAANGMPLGSINSATNWYIFEKDMLIVSTGSYTYFINVADLSHVIIRGLDESVFKED